MRFSRLKPPGALITVGTVSAVVALDAPPAPGASRPVRLYVPTIRGGALGWRQVAAAAPKFHDRHGFHGGWTPWEGAALLAAEAQVRGAFSIPSPEELP